MTKTRLLSTVAASLLLSVGVASAQSPNTQAPARAPAAQQGAPAEKVAPPLHAGERKASERKTPETTGQAPKESPGEMKAKPAERGGAEMKAKPDERGGKATKSGADKQGASDTKSKTENRAERGARTDKSTTGQGAAAGSAKLSTEQRTRITTVIRSQKVQRVEPSQLNVSIRVGVRVPSSIRFYPLPAEVVTIYPRWRGYDYILVGDQILVVDPRSHQIVAILEA